MWLPKLSYLCPNIGILRLSKSFVFDYWPQSAGPVSLCVSLFKQQSHALVQVAALIIDQITGVSEQSQGTIKGSSV